MSARIDGCPFDPTEPVCKGCPSAEECLEMVTAPVSDGFDHPDAEIGEHPAVYSSETGWIN